MKRSGKRITKREWYDLGGFRVTGLYRVEVSGRWYYYDARVSL